MGKIVVSIIMGSLSDSEIMSQTSQLLREFGIGYEMKVLSAHRTPDALRQFATKAKGRGIKVIIAVAGGAAHLAGVIASCTTLPVIGIPVYTKILKGIDSYLSTLQMPSGVPVATVAIGQAGAKNAAILAAQILALNDKQLADKLAIYKKNLAKAVLKKTR